ncbi:recombinase family protein [Cellulophaga sp. Z1A5H]|uniref:recombinase family protein n=1 Tax=Cellulophaga sp. Z1A5H TaxID=2687291 RepID=UPI0013FD38EA|nr:recombinase family protein [Cellulophaga sp. Z1A5H]
MKARYIRISTVNQNYERQLRNQYSDELIFIDVCSGSIPFKERKEGGNLLSSLERIDYISVSSIDRLGRNLLDILNTLEILNKNKVILFPENLGIESLLNGKPNTSFKLIISVLGNIAEMEREIMLERQREGIELAKAKGLYTGRERGSKEEKHYFLSKYPNVIKYLKKGQSLRNTAKLSDVSLGTVQKVNRLISK